MVKFIDIDNTICSTNGLDYVSAMPFNDKIAIVNKWYDEGHTIIYWTARGCADDEPHRKKLCEVLTKKQLHDWGCKYHELKMDKPLFDEFYDDRAFNAREIN